MLQWSNQLSVSNDTIDGQHRKLITLTNNLYELYADYYEGADYYDDIMETLNQLYDYTKTHFKYEEALMEQADYKGLEEHKLEHEFFVNYLDKYMDDDIDEDQLKHLKDMLDFLSQWVTHHILDVDKQYISMFSDESA